MKMVRLKEDMPLFFRGHPTFYKAGKEFEFVEQETLPDGQLYYRVRYPGTQWVFDGHTRASCFEDAPNKRGHRGDAK